ncbi:hypothetical protein ABW21_db0204932 [Orbilia brochopaga]|nr:hypothetical protein ABW21_db0204932 [Drechslerella brochopaga]
MDPTASANTTIGEPGCTLILVVLGLPLAYALSWDDFTNNFATDLAPLVTLFGEQVTKQFLSESLSIWDNIIFAMAPLDLLTAVVSAIRVCGTPSMRAFIGRAQESPGTAEVELLSCTSETTAELFNEGGIARVFGEPRILEVMVKPSDTDPKGLVVGSFADLKWETWFETGSENFSRERGSRFRYHRPNLSLNVGITRLPLAVTYAAAVVGVVLQIGMLVFAALTIYVYPNSFITTSGRPADVYAFSMTFIGTILVCVGMFLCAFIIERSTDEIHYKQKQTDKQKLCRIYWVQPGGQSIGDQVFGSSIGFSENPYYIRSVKAENPKFREVNILRAAVSTSMIGFIVQFVGLRAMHASVILFQIGATILMAIIRAMLRTQRLDRMKNVLGSPKGRSARLHPFLQDPKLLHGHELDLLALHLHQIDSLTISFVPDEGLERPRTDIDSRRKVQLDEDGNANEYDYRSGGPRSFKDVAGPLETRIQLAKLTGRGKGPSWEDLKTRVVATQLLAAIEGVMEVISPILGLSASPGDMFTWCVALDIVPLADRRSPTVLWNDSTSAGGARRPPRILSLRDHTNSLISG